ncbi:hypothetical protein VCUG_00262 [Vavraia culicis subsp. floridensis]|uniref:Uncharacterized protein n=1 Tax=Vavraia culicis (isolate floridensis) TaxID=948595 RepID=L2GX12_VAVCU|nr:uncharacterized protein VCUG_00262 [Vavraia culicis subsp. floridensis]ELA48221.1 hypothetical protein VCUG_00262 [Vavraia culicis subsp. floridensis]
MVRTEDKLKKYKSKIKSLKNKLKCKKIIIKSLLHTLQKKKYKKRRSDSSVKRKEKDEIKKRRKVSNVLGQGTEQIIKETSNDGRMLNKSDGAAHHEIVDAYTVLERNNCENEDKSFKLNFKLDEYVDYTCSLFVPYICDAKDTYKLSKQHAIYIKTNRKCILKHIFKDINTREIEKTWTLLFNLGCTESYEALCVVVHDLFVFVEDFERVFYLSYALLHNKKFEVDILSKTIRMLLSYQALIMRKVNSGVEFGYKIQEEMDLFDHFDVNSLCNVILEDNSFSHLNVASLRIICSFMDWNWTYNTFIVQMLYPRFVETNRPILLFYMGVICTLGYKNFGMHESVQSIFDEIKTCLDKDNVELSAIACSFVKNFDLDLAEKWGTRNKVKYGRQSWFDHILTKNTF